jgi:proteasome alpha subunit
MLDELHRWTDAISDRREYIESQLIEGSPVVALAYEDGILLLTVSKDQKKIYEIYDRIAFSAIGHPADVEKIRNIFIDYAHLEGFNRSVADVTLQRLVKFGISPIIKQAFDEIFRSPFTIKILMAELVYHGNGYALYSINYDGTFKSSTKFEVITGSEVTEKEMRERLQTVSNPEKLKLKEAVKIALEAWAYGKRALKLQGSRPDSSSSSDTSDTSDNSESSSHQTDPKQVSAEIDEILTEELKYGNVEAAVLQRSKPGNSKFRMLTKSEMGIKN